MKQHVLKSDFIGGDDKHTVPVRVVLSHLPDNDLHPWVTHIEREDTPGLTMSGNYFETEREVLDDYYKRIKMLGG